MGRYKTLIGQKIDKMQANLTQIDKKVEDHHEFVNDHIDKISLKYKEDIIDIKSSNQGFARELERVQIIFRELQTEFLYTLEEKRMGNDMMLRGAKLKAKEMERIKDQAKQASENSIASLLPQLNKLHEQSTIELSNR